MFNTKGTFLNGILPVKKFRTQIDLIKININKNLKLPTEMPVELAKVAKVSTRTTADFVLFNIQLPLISNEVFYAYEIYTYPTIHDGFSINLHASSRYFLIDERKTLYYSLDENNFDHCQKMEELTLCHQIHPLFNTRTTTSCEVQLFLKSKGVPESCKIEIKQVRKL